MSYDAARRAFLKSSASTAGSVWLALGWPGVISAAGAAAEAHAAAAPFANLQAAEARDFEAIAAQIIPSDDRLPGAREAGVIYFIDAALGTFMAGQAGALREGLAALNAKARTKQPDAAGFADLPSEAQIALLTAEEASPFFGTMRFVTVLGMFALPSYGGNRDGAGWKVLGFDHRHAWAPPFGYYDADGTKGA